MKLHEYQAKEVIAKQGVPIQKGKVAFSAEEAVEAARTLYDNATGKEWYVLKAQIHAGGRGKGGGVKLAKSLDEVRDKSKDMIGMRLVTHQTGPEGKIVQRLLVAQDVFYPGPSELKEYYFSITLDRVTGRLVVIASAEGGMDIEEVAEHHPEKIVKEWIDPVVGLEAFQARKIAFKMGFSGEALKHAVPFIMKIYKAYMDNDCSLLEINPMLKTSDDKIIAVDCKMDIDDNAMFRHADLAEMRDLNEEDSLEVEASAHNLNYINLTGNVGCMVNGAGLAMATMDMIKLSGGEPANFLDVGGGANAQTVEAGFRIILKDPAVKAILVNIFGGIVRCDRVANGIVEAYKNIGNINVPIIVRLQGTNAVEAAKIIDESGLKVTSAITLAEAAQRVKDALATLG
jgi:succinyl-CoA synthetase beta subunit